jgi:glucose-6-phosphate isomerase
LIALYEHKVFAQSVIWGTNAFDQWGVELGKVLGQGVYSRLVGSEKGAAEDGSTQGLIDFFRGRHRG